MIDAMLLELLPGQCQLRPRIDSMIDSAGTYKDSDGVMEAVEL